MTEPPDHALLPLPDRLARCDPPVGEGPLALVRAEHAHWRGLHDRLVAIIAALLDHCVRRGEPLADVLADVIATTRVDVGDLVGRVPGVAEIAALLRAHGSVGTVRREAGRTEFRHDCGSGLAYWRRNPDLPVVAAGEVPGVPGGVPHYCARCIATIDAAGAGRWRVAPPTDPTDPDSRCTWLLDDPGDSPDPVAAGDGET